tara:strand:- start:553 stop:684 length:132 start_codon:yes stop_codon:yes gene_type:complete
MEKNIYVFTRIFLVFFWGWEIGVLEGGEKKQLFIAIVVCSFFI